ncbi:MAG TPA: flagellar biosynthesis protein FlhB [Oscillatoriaceae cyanobacterium]
MAETGGQEKTEKPTPRRLSEARKKGQVAKSLDVNTGVMLLVGILAIKWQFSAIGQQMVELTTRLFTDLPTGDFSKDSFYHLLIFLGERFGLMIAPLLLVLLISGLLVNYLQVGVLFTSEPLKPNLEKINPLSGLKRMFSLRSVVETLKAILKMAVVGVIVYQVIRNHYSELAGAILLDKIGVANLFAQTAWEICWKAVFALVIFGLLDLFYQRWDYERGLKMTKQEIRDEAKQSEGDPLIKGRIRRAQREASRRRMMAEVPKATVVITNPTHFAVALRYDRGSMDAPKVVAKGVDLVAQRIKAIAGEADVPIVENKPLARELYKKVEIDETIPEELYTAVAEILVVIQRLNKRKRAMV